MEQLTNDAMFRRFIGLSMDAPVWDVIVFTKNRDRLPADDIVDAFPRTLLADPHAGQVVALGWPFYSATIWMRDRVRRVASIVAPHHFSVDGTLIEAWSSMKSVQPKDSCGEPPADGRNGELDFHGERHGYETHVSTSATDATCYKKADGQVSTAVTSGTR
jgi:hypothetical protein